MLTKRRLTAVFADGKQVFRTPAPLREYTHAWRVTWLRPLNAQGIPTNVGGRATYSTRETGEHGFATSFELAQRAVATVVARVSNWKGYELLTTEIVKATEDTVDNQGGLIEP